MFPSEKLIGQYVYFVNRRGREDGTILGGTVTRVDAVGRLMVSTMAGPRTWAMGQVTTTVAQAKR